MKTSKIIYIYYLHILYIYITISLWTRSTSINSWLKLYTYCGQITSSMNIIFPKNVCFFFSVNATKPSKTSIWLIKKKFNPPAIQL